MRGKFTQIVFLSLVILFLISTLYSQKTNIRVIKEDAALRLKPSNDSLLIKALPLGAILEVEETLGDWVKVKLPPDKDGIVIFGYVHSSFVTFDIKPLASEKAERIDAPLRKDDAYTIWQQRLSSAKKKSSTGLIIGIVGAAIFIPSSIALFVDKREELYISYSSVTYQEKPKPGYLVLAGVGLTSLVAGMAIHFSGKRSANQLEQEGRKKGYISAGLLPGYNAIGVQIGISF
ncbi:SH3 domain-containing protein [Acidobacteriota bacterium]